MISEEFFELIVEGFKNINTFIALFIWLVKLVIFSPSRDMIVIPSLGGSHPDTKSISINGIRPAVEAFGFRLLMGNYTEYNSGLLLSVLRTTKMQKLKLDVIIAQKKRIYKNLNGKVHTNIVVDYSEFVADRENSSKQVKGIRDYVNTVTRSIIKKILNLPDNIDLEQIGEISTNYKDFVNCFARFSFPGLRVLAAIITNTNIVPSNTKLYQGQEYLKNIVYSRDWDDDNYCNDVIQCGKKHKLDATGVLAELLTG